MPKTLQVRDLSDDVHAILRSRAELAGQSLSEYVKALLVTETSRHSIREVLDRAASRSGGASHEDIIAAIRAVRDGRDG